VSALEPSLYRATINDKADVIVMKGRDEAAYLTSTGHLATRRITSVPLTNARPLIVLDLEDHGQVNASNLAQVLREDGYPRLADQIEAQTKPARIPEPGLWGVVKAGYAAGVSEWVKREDGWQSRSGTVRPWIDLKDPVLIRKGVES
jgi:hypothetical protein